MEIKDTSSTLPMKAKSFYLWEYLSDLNVKVVVTQGPKEVIKEIKRVYHSDKTDTLYININ